MKLYKFKSLEGDGLLHCLDMMVNERIYMSTCDYMNDHEEGGWGQVELPVDDDLIEMQQKIKLKVDAIRFTSFTDDFSNALLWAHYAGGFSGVCFEYEFDTKKFEIHQMTYKGIPSLSHDHVINISNGHTTPQEAGILLSKSPCWHYENEYRIFLDVNSREKYVVAKPEKIIFGGRGLKYDSVLLNIAKKFGYSVAYLSKTGDKYEALSI